MPDLSARTRQRKSTASFTQDNGTHAIRDEVLWRCTGSVGLDCMLGYIESSVVEGKVDCVGKEEGVGSQDLRGNYYCGVVVIKRDGTKNDEKGEKRRGAAESLSTLHLSTPVHVAS